MGSGASGASRPGSEERRCACTSGGEDSIPLKPVRVKAYTAEEWEADFGETCRQLAMEEMTVESWVPALGHASTASHVSTPCLGEMFEGTSACGALQPLLCVQTYNAKQWEPCRKPTAVSTAAAMNSGEISTKDKQQGTCSSSESGADSKPLEPVRAMGYAGDEFEARFGEICRKLAMQEGQE
ncbi:unnamed protein product [Durusdinium trenchii]|uniref:Uncharacterized protein n=1 Tax=Durusdinium trenchii TaxID=1381693 RepID=A0ABP0LCR2_9DINO